MRHIILHHHILKNAGTTLDHALERKFAAGFATLHDDAAGVVTEDVLLAFLDANPAVRAVSSHHFHGQDYSGRDYRFFTFAMVRRPLERLVSIYKYSRHRGDADDDLTRLARTSDIREFMDGLIDRFPHMVESAQVNLFANHGFYGRPTSDGDLERAIARLRDFSLCAPVERYAEAMVTLEYFNAPVYLPEGLDLAFEPQNVSPPLDGENDLRALLGDARHDWLSAVNERDAALWTFANAELDRRIALVPDFARRLAAFHARCDRLKRPEESAHVDGARSA